MHRRPLRVLGPANLLRDGREGVSKIDCVQAGDVTIRLSHNDRDLDLHLLGDTCDHSADCVDGSASGLAVDDVITFTCTAGDSDGDGVADGCDACDRDPTDSDGDGNPDICDPCPSVAFEVDSDADGAWDRHDGDETISPDGDEVLDGIDNDGVGIVDEGPLRYDDDGDGFTEDAGDRDDADPPVYPGAAELDDDCDGDVAEDFIDLDADGWTVLDGNSGDFDGWVHPDAAEVCDGRDNDRNGGADEGCIEPEGDKDSSGGCGCAQGSSPAGWPAILSLLAAGGWRRRLAA